MRPQVLFVEHGTWEAFTALASALRRRRVAVARVTSPPRGRSRALLMRVERLVYGREVLLVQPPTTRGAAASITEVAALVGPDVVDVQAVDQLSHRMLGDDPSLVRVIHRAGADRSALLPFEKTAVLEVAARAGIRVPVALEPGCAQFPAVVKSDVGSGGDRVRVVHDHQQLDEALRELEHLAGSRPTVQQYWGGGEVSVGAVARDGEAIVIVVYATEPAAHDRHGPPAFVTILERPDIIDDARRLLEAIGATGFVALGFVLDDQQRAYLIDYNPRAFGSWPALQAAGADFIGAYLHAIGVGPRPEAATCLPGRREFLLRFPSGATTWSHQLTWTRDSVLVVVRRTRMLGWRWAAVSLTKITSGTLLGAAVLSRGRRSTT